MRLLKTRTSVEVCAALERMTSFFESLSFAGFEITDSPPDRAREFTALYFQKLLSNHRSIYHTLTTVYDPQANGAAERYVGLMKALSARCLTTSGLPQEFWGYAVKYAAQSLLCSSLQKKTEVTSLWLSSHRTGAQSQESEVSRAEINIWKIVVLGSPPGSTVLSPLSTIRGRSRTYCAKGSTSSAGPTGHIRA